MRLISWAHGAGFTPTDEAIVGHDFDDRRIKRIYLAAAHCLWAVLDRQIMREDVNFLDFHVVTT
jgi:hypothetical protein